MYFTPSSFMCNARQAMRIGNLVLQLHLVLYEMPLVWLHANNISSVLCPGIQQWASRRIIHRWDMDKPSIHSAYIWYLMTLTSLSWCGLYFTATCISERFIFKQGPNFLWAFSLFLFNGNERFHLLGCMLGLKWLNRPWNLLYLSDSIGISLGTLKSFTKRYWQKQHFKYA